MNIQALRETVLRQPDGVHLWSELEAAAAALVGMLARQGLGEVDKAEVAKASRAYKAKLRQLGLPESTNGWDIVQSCI